MKFAPIGSFRPHFSDSTGVCPSRSESFQVMNALLLPLVLGFLYLLARRRRAPLSGGIVKKCRVCEPACNIDQAVPPPTRSIKLSSKYYRGALRDLLSVVNFCLSGPLEANRAFAERPLLFRDTLAPPKGSSFTILGNDFAAARNFSHASD